MTIRNYLGELPFLFSYYPDVPPLDFDSEMVMKYLLYVTKILRCGRSKCCMSAQSVSFFFKHVLHKPYVVPTLIFPRKVKTPPAVMSAEEIFKVINAVDNIKHRTMLTLLYSTGIRLSELVFLRISEIDSKSMRVKVVQGKGLKDRYTILSKAVLLELRAYYVQYRPIEYLFNGSGKGRRYSTRTIQKVIQNAIIKARLEITAWALPCSIFMSASSA